MPRERTTSSRRQSCSRRRSRATRIISSPTASSRACMIDNYLNGPDHTPSRLALAGAALKAAQRLRPDAGETHLARAEHLYCGRLDYEAARRELELARRSLPNEPLVYQLSAFIDRRQGRWAESTAISSARSNSIRATPTRCSRSRSAINFCAVSTRPQPWWIAPWRSCLTIPACSSSERPLPSMPTPIPLPCRQRLRKLSAAILARPRGSPMNGFSLRSARETRRPRHGPSEPCGRKVTATPASFFREPGAKA